MILALLHACAPVDPPAPAVAPTLVSLDAPRLLRRMSLDLRGELPSVAELDAVEADPTRLDALRDAMLEDPRLEARLVELFAERFLTLLDVYEVKHYDYHLGPEDEYRFERAVGEEPLRIMAYAAMHDLPWSEIVTGDWTMADEMLASIWPVTYPEGATGWQVSHYTDGRPAAGVLATNGLWWRYVTNPSNMNRGRAAAIERLFLCEDVLSRPVSFSASVTLATGTDDAIRTNEACIACHSSVDPLAAALFGFYWYTQYNAAEMTTYHPERETLAHLDTYLGVEPAWFGTPLAGLADLGTHVAADHRFERCAAESAVEMLWRRSVTTDDFDDVEAIRARFVAGGLSYRSLLADVTDAPAYRAGSLGAAADDATDARERTERMMTAPLLASSVAGLTGFAWTWSGADQLANDVGGYRTLAGGVDGENVTAPQSDPGLTWALAVKRLAEGAADWSVRTELAGGPDGEGLLHYVAAEDRPGDAAFTQELDELYWRLYARRADAAWRTSAETLWSAAAEGRDAQGAWIVLVSAMIRDPDFVGY
ncbi:MAG: hypothetical protein Q8P41_00525 [Pseudomonadota bacterium]|nr:hypothetical protein [Pseudomonadota bacterium]